MNQILTWLTSFKKECSVCTGTGKIACKCNENNEITCPSCNGKGAVSRQVTTTQKMEIPCDHPQCQQGKVLCGICNGTGKNPQGEPCAACRGSGKIDCPVCGGVGRIQRVKQESWLEHETCHICNGRGMVECYLCHGTKERVCPTCKGKGTVLNQGKIAVLLLLAVLIVAMPMLFIAVAAILLGYGVFQLVKAQTQEAAQEAADDSEQNE